MGTSLGLADNHYCLGLPSSDIDACNQAAAAVFDRASKGPLLCAFEPAQFYQSVFSLVWELSTHA